MGMKSHLRTPTRGLERVKRLVICEGAKKVLPDPANIIRNVEIICDGDKGSLKISYKN